MSHCLILSHMPNRAAKCLFLLTCQPVVLPQGLPSCAQSSLHVTLPDLPGLAACHATVQPLAGAAVGCRVAAPSCRGIKCMQGQWGVDHTPPARVPNSAKRMAVRIDVWQTITEAAKQQGGSALPCSPYWLQHSPSEHLAAPGPHAPPTGATGKGVQAGWAGELPGTGGAAAEALQPEPVPEKPGWQSALQWSVSTPHQPAAQVRRRPCWSCGLEVHQCDAIHASHWLASAGRRSTPAARSWACQHVRYSVAELLTVLAAALACWAVGDASPTRSAVNGNRQRITHWQSRRVTGHRLNDRLWAGGRSHRLWAGGSRGRLAATGAKSREAWLALGVAVVS